MTPASALSRLRAARRRVDAAEAQLAYAKADRDRLIRELRALDEPLSARVLGEVAGISNVQVLRIAEAAG